MAKKLPAPAAMWRRLNDAWESVVQLGMGANSNSAAKNWIYRPPPKLAAAKLHDLYDGLWLARVIVDKKPQMALKRGMQASPAALSAYARLGHSPQHPDGVFATAAQWARLEGGALLVAQHAQGAGNMKAPLLGGGGDVRWLDAFPRSWLKMTERQEDPEAIEPAAPILWEVTAGPRKGLEFHHSRAIVFTGNTPSPTARAADHENFWGVSCLQSIYEELLRVGQRNAAVDRLLSRASIAALKLQGLLESIAAEERTALDNRLQILREGVEATNLMLLEGDEDFAVHNVNLTGLDAPILSSLQMVAGAARYPMVVLFGMSPGGLNATGESDMRIFNDELLHLQNQYKPAAERMFSWLSGQEEKVEFLPPLVPTADEQATTLEKLLRAYQILEGEWGVVEAAPLAAALKRMGLLPADLQIIELDPLGLAPVPEAVKLDLAPTDIAKVVRVDEVRKSQGLPSIGDERGKKTIFEMDNEAKEAQAAARVGKEPAV